MLVASRRATPSDSGAPSDQNQKPTAVAPPSGKPKRAAAKARKAAPEAEAAPSTGTDHPQEEKDDGEEEKAAEVAVAVAGEEAAAPAEPVKRKRGRRKLIHDEEERKIRRKMQCKLNQRRYRARQRGMITTLALDAEKTIDNIQELEAYHRFLCEFDQERTSVASASHGVMDGRPSIVVKHFTELFRHGFALHSVEVGDLQESFLRFAMDPALQSQGATERGIDALILQLKRYSSYHAVFEMLPEAIAIIDEPRPGPLIQGQHFVPPMAAVVHVTGKLHLRVSRDTVMLLYPHIVEDEELNLRVVGHEIYPAFSMVFYFNPFAKVEKFEFTVDFVAAFMQLLRSSSLTTRLLEQAIITPCSELGVDPHGAFETDEKRSKQLSLKFILL